MKNIVVERKVLENINHLLEEVFTKQYDEVYILTDEDIDNALTEDFLRHTLDFSGSLNVGANSFKGLYEILKDQYTFLVCKLNNKNGYEYYLIDKFKNVFYKNGCIKAIELYKLGYEKIIEMIGRKEEYDKYVYTDILSQLVNLGDIILIGNDEYMILTDCENTTFFSVSLDEKNLKDIVSFGDTSFYTKGFRGFKGIKMDDCSSTWEIIHELVLKYKGEVIKFKTPGKITETEIEFSINIVSGRNV